MTTAQVVETSVSVNNNSPIQDYVYLDDQTQPTFEMLGVVGQLCCDGLHGASDSKVPEKALTEKAWEDVVRGLEN